MKDLQVQFTPANIVANIDELKAQLAERLKPYQGMVLAADQIGEGKKLVAALNKEKKAVGDSRRTVMNQHKAAASPFEEGMKALEGMYDDATADMKAQIAASEEARKAEAAEALTKFLSHLWRELEVADDYQSATIDGLVTLTAITGKGHPVAKVANELRSRAAADRALQDRTEMRLLKLENESYKAGLHAPLTRDHIETFLFADDEVYSAELARILKAEVERQRTTETLVVAREQARPNTAQAAPADTAPSDTSATVESIAVDDGEHPYTVTVTFVPTVRGNVSAEQLEASLRKRLAEAGFTSPTSIVVSANSAAA